MTMPEMTGVELIRQVRAGGSSVPAILASGYLGRAADLPPDVAPHAFLVPKPFVVAELARVLSEVLTAAADPERT